jgi:hypothetical protein
LYWADRDLDVIRRANLNGSDVETIVSVPAPGNNGAPYFLELDPDRNKLYWSAFDSGVIHRVNLDGSSPDIVVSSLDRVRDIEILGDMIYWTDRDTRLVERQNLNGTGREILFGPSGLVLPHGLALDQSSGFLYVADADGGQVYRGSLDGANSLEAVGPASLQNPWDVALIVDPRAGDYNGDGAIDAADYVAWRDGLGPKYTEEDYDVWRANFGRMSDSGTAESTAKGRSAGVPEPVTLAMLIAATPALYFADVVRR